MVTSLSHGLVVTCYCFEEVEIEYGDGTCLNEEVRGGCCMMKQRQAWTVGDYVMFVVVVAVVVENVVPP